MDRFSSRTIRLKPVFLRKCERSIIFWDAMSTIEQMIEELQHSPRLPQIVSTLKSGLKAEESRRRQFYEEMTPEEKVEFIDGEVVLHSPARNRHLDATMNIATLLRSFVEIHELGELKIEKCLVVFPRNDYEPDIVFFDNSKAASLQPDTMKFPVPDFVVEVLSESTETRDRGVKFEDFETNGVAEYWIVDTDDETLEQYLLQDGHYKLAMKSASGTVSSQVISGFSVEVEAFFDRGKNLAALKSLMA